MKRYQSSLISFLLVMVLGGCVTAPATKLSNLTQQHRGELADLSIYNNKAYVFFKVQDGAVDINKINTKIDRTEIEKLYSSNNTKQNNYTECITIQAKTPRYEPCFITLGLNHLKEKSIFTKGNVNAGGVLGTIIATPFALVGATLNALTLNPKGVENNVKSLGKGTMSYSVDQQAVQQVGGYIDDQLAQAQKNARYALETYNVSNIKQAKGLQGLLKDDELYQAYVKANTNTQRVAVFNILGLIDGEDQRYDKFAQVVLRSPKDLPLWAETLNETSYKPRLSLAQAKAIPKFASSENMQNFFNSNEYRYVLQYLKPEKITPSISGREAAIHVSYGDGVGVDLKRPAICQPTNSYTKTSKLNTGFLAALLLMPTYNTTDQVTEYTCKPAEGSLAQLQAWEKQLTGNIVVTNNFPTSWNTKQSKEISRVRESSASSHSNSTLRNTKYEIKDVKETGGWGYSGYYYSIYCNNTGWAGVNQINKLHKRYSTSGISGFEVYSTLDQAARAACKMN